MALFIAMIAIGYSFGPVQKAIGGPLLDMMWSGADASARLAEMNTDQKRAHLLATVLNDTAYPLAYGGLFAGLIWRFAGSSRRWLIVPPLAAIVVDLAENLVQALALAGNDALLGLKDVLTPAKFALSLIAVVLVLISVILAIVRRVRAS